MASWRDLRRLLPESMLGRGSLTLTAGAVSGQLILLAASPFLTRVYSADAFGVFGVYLSLLGIISVVSSLRYQIAIPLPSEDSRAVDLVLLSSLILVGFSVVAALVLTGARGWLLGVANTTGTRHFSWAVPLGVLTVGAYQILKYWALREKAFVGISLGKALEGGVRGISQSLLSLLVAGPGGLIGGHILGQLTGGVVLVRVMWGRRRGLSEAATNLGRLRAVAVEYKRFPLYSSWSSVFNTISAQLPLLLLASFFGTAIEGFYSLTAQVLGAPLQLIGQSISQAFLSQAPEAARDGTIRQVTLDVFCRLVRLALPVSVVLAIAAPELFSVLFGVQWRVSGIYCQWLTPWLFFVFVSSPLSMLPSIMEKQGAEMLFHGSLLVFRTAGIVTGALVQSVFVTIALFSGVGAAWWLFFMSWSMRLTGSRARDPFRIIGKELAGLLPYMMPLVAAKVLLRNDLYIVGVAAVTCGCMAVRLLVHLRVGHDRGGTSSE